MKSTFPLLIAALMLPAAVLADDAPGATPAPVEQKAAAAAPAQAEPAPKAEAAALKSAAPAAKTDAVPTKAEAAKVEAPVKPAQEATPTVQKAEVPAPAPVKAAVKADANPVEAKPEAKPVVAKKAEKPAAPAAFKPIGASAPYQGVIDAYAEACKSFEDWVRDASNQAKDLDDREQSLKTDIQGKEAQITKLKLENSKDSAKEVKQLTQETKALWADLDKMAREKATLRRSLSRSAGAKVREINAGVGQKLSEAQAAE